MSLASLHTVAQVAEALVQTERYVEERCRRREWPHRRLARGEVRFTDDDYAQILDLIRAEPVAPEPQRLSFAPRSRRAS
jgi:hypothetical protein